MKLIHKFTVWYLCIALCCTVIGSLLTYNSVKHKIDESASGRLTAINLAVANKLAQGLNVDSFIDGRKVVVQSVAELSGTETVSCEEIISPATGLKECRLGVTSFHEAGGKFYKISSYDYVTKGKDILAGMEYSIIRKWVLILLLIGISAGLASRIILGPFHQTLKAIGSFSLRQKEKIQLPSTNTKEFRQLNSFLRTMTDKAREDYEALKEFTENASHELQTPVAIIQGKAELMAETGLPDHQALLLSDIQDSIEKLSRINSSLVLLTRLENHEYDTGEPLRFCRAINETIASYKELMELKSLSLTKSVEKRVWVKLHPDLAHLLLNNLISNAIRHNSGEGKIEIRLTRSALTVRNTGSEPDAPTEELFQRFKKGKQCGQSIGIGLAIVKQICDLNQLAVQYTYHEGWHSVELRFVCLDVAEEAPVTEDDLVWQPAV